MLSVSTNWNSRRHQNGNDLLDEVLSLGVHTVELGYALTHGQLEDLRHRFQSGDFRVSSVHAFSPFPFPEAEHASPEPYSLCIPPISFFHPFGARPEAIAEAENAVLDCARLAAEFGARRLVLHAGRIPVHSLGIRLHRIVQNGKRGTPLYERTLRRLLVKRDRLAAPRIDALRTSLDRILPKLGPLDVTLCLENLPTADGCPNEPEMMLLLQAFEGAPLAYWHDIGHAQIRHELGLMHHRGFLRQIGRSVGGFHVHDVSRELHDHCMPPGGLVDFRLFSEFVSRPEIPVVLEPRPDLPAADIARGLDYLRGLWETLSV